MLLAPRLWCRGVTVMACSFLALALGAQIAQASSGEAWEEFRQDVERACRAETKNMIDAQVVQVDPYGSESYGFATLVGPEPSTNELRLVVCAYNKRTQLAEVSGTFKW